MVAVRHFMSSAVHRLSPKDPLAEAFALVEEHGVRHFPIVDRDAVVGILTLSDLAVIDSTLALDHNSARVGEVMTRDPYCVDAELSVGAISREMSRRRIGSALVTESGKLVGVFTATDAVRALGVLIE